MNIVEAYIKFNNKLIIVISGLSGSGKTHIASFIERDFKLKLINIDNYCVKDYENRVEIYEGIKINDWDHIDAYDWDKINKDVNSEMEKGVVVCGPYFPTDKIDFLVDFHINIKISKQKLIDARHNYIKNNPDKCKELVKFLDTPTEIAIINKIVYPHYLDYTQKSKIDKYINANEITIDQVYDQAADFLFNKIKEFLDNYNKKNKHISTKSSTSHKSKTTEENYESTDDESTNDNDSTNEDESIDYDEIKDYDVSDDAIYLGRTQNLL